MPLFLFFDFLSSPILIVPRDLNLNLWPIVLSFSLSFNQAGFSLVGQVRERCGVCASPHVFACVHLWVLTPTLQRHSSLDHRTWVHLYPELREDCWLGWPLTSDREWRGWSSCVSSWNLWSRKHFALSHHVFSYTHNHPWPSTLLSAHQWSSWRGRTYSWISSPGSFLPVLPASGSLTYVACTKIRPLWNTLTFPPVQRSAPINLVTEGWRSMLCTWAGSCESWCPLGSVLARHGRIALDPSELQGELPFRMDSNTPAYMRDQDLPCLSSGSGEWEWGCNEALHISLNSPSTAEVLYSA